MQDGGLGPRVQKSVMEEPSVKRPVWIKKNKQQYKVWRQVCWVEGVGQDWVALWIPNTPLPSCPSSPSVLCRFPHSPLGNYKLPS